MLVAAQNRSKTPQNQPSEIWKRLNVCRTESSPYYNFQKLIDKDHALCLLPSKISCWIFKHYGIVWSLLRSRDDSRINATTWFGYKEPNWKSALIERLLDERSGKFENCVTFLLVLNQVHKRLCTYQQDKTCFPLGVCYWGRVLSHHFLSRWWWKLLA